MFTAQSFGRRVFVVAITVVALHVLFYNLPLQSILFSALTAFLFFFWGEYTARRELKNNVKIRFFKISNAYTAKFITGLVLSGILLYVPIWSNDNLFISKPAYETLFEWTKSISEGIFPAVDFSGSFEELATGIIREQAARDPRFSMLSELDRKERLKESVDKFLDSLSQRFGIQVEKQENAREATYRLVTDALRKLRETYGALFIIGWALFIFLLVRGLGSVFLWLVTLASFITYEILLAANFIRVVNVNAYQEIIEYG